jgi:acetyl-CoA carboxylase beta subunit
LLAYAQKRIRLLEDTLKAREQHEGKLLEEALKKQENEHEKLSAMKLKYALEKLKTELNTVMIQKVNVNVCKFLFLLCEYTHVKTHKLLQVCKQVVTNLFTSCQQVVFALLVSSCCNKFGTSC